MKLRKLAVSLTAALATGALGAAYAQSSDPASSADQSATLSPSTSSDSNVGMRNTDENAPSSVQQDQSPSGASSPGIDRDPSAPSAPLGGTYRTDSSSGSGSSGHHPATSNQGGRQPAPY